ncbi:DNA methyltransferase [Coraliomargarita sp. SDUM461004]|uniref:site-specific DNA-methyltransferase (cytosine-N(4)-specific) n=1 Tax=Thalassobacterium sedimentorum TaxID=3041258 RepID=A0ABU1AGY7_9BACT|nr:DNA methyltransferase [Coraliomargarita sp. SDUM461004]MDQ8193041.1 DNA methyltransferase [Coraliomargarita sp. SDUM461004]
MPTTQATPRSSNLIKQGAFWTAKQRDGHSIHEISYRACYKPQLPAYFIQRYAEPGQLIYDPFMGRGTTLIEAKLLGHNVIGNDVNPLSTILTAPRLCEQSLEQIAYRIEGIELPKMEIEDEDLLVFFEYKTLRELYGWRRYFKARHQAGTFDAIDAWLQMVACNRLTGHSKGFFSVYTLPPNQATTLNAQRKINTKREQKPEYRNTKELMLKKSKSLLRHALPENYNSTSSTLLCRSADATPEIQDESVQLIVTSPPFLDIVNYVGDNWLRNWFCQCEPEPGKLWQLRKLEDWTEKMTASLQEMSRVLKPQGRIALEVGEVRKGKLKLEEQIILAGQAAGLKVEYTLINSQSFTKTANCWGVRNNTRGTNSNRIVVFKK